MRQNRDAEVAVVQPVAPESLEQEVVVPPGVHVGVDDARIGPHVVGVGRDVGLDRRDAAAGQTCWSPTMVPQNVAFSVRLP